MSLRLGLSLEFVLFGSQEAEPHRSRPDTGRDGKQTGTHRGSLSDVYAGCPVESDSGIGITIWSQRRTGPIIPPRAFLILNNTQPRITTGTFYLNISAVVTKCKFLFVCKCISHLKNYINQLSIYSLKSDLKRFKDQSLSGVLIFFMVLNKIN